jgi:hypothetical protein
LLRTGLLLTGSARLGLWIETTRSKDERAIAASSCHASRGSLARFRTAVDSEKRLEMKTLLIVLAALCMALAVSAQTKTKLLTTDLLTGLPLNPATDPGMNLGNEPTAMPGTTVCKSKTQARYYSLFYITTDGVVAWYTANLHGFTVANGTESDRAQVVPCKPDGTVVVIVTGGLGTPNAHSVAYERCTPGLSEKAIVGMTRGNIVCPKTRNSISIPERKIQ